MNTDINMNFNCYCGKSEEFLNVINSMLPHMEDAYTFKVYVYLCLKFDLIKGHSIPSIRNISKDCDMSERKVVSCLKWLSEQGYIIKKKYEEQNVVKNMYKIMYVENVDNECIEISEDSNCYVYVHRNKRTGEVIYVGKGVGRRAFDLKSRNAEYLKYIQNVGKNNIQIDIIDKFDTNIEAYGREKELTDYYKSINQARFNKVSGFNNMNI